MREPRRLRLGILAAAALVVMSGCSLDDRPDVDAAASFDRFPLYWLGERFERWDVTSISGLQDGSSAVVVIYGTCTADGGLEPSCTPPLQLQIFPLCWHLDAVAWPRPRGVRSIRGAPVGTQDSAPVLLTRETQIKVYRGEGSDAAAALRALRGLRSLNAVAPVISETDRIPPPPPGVLEGKRPCTSGTANRPG